jgi:hypothetical protein
MSRASETMHVLSSLTGFRRERGTQLTNDNDQKSSSLSLSLVMMSHV